MPPFAGSVDKDEDVPMAGNPPSESLAGIEEAAPLYLEYITSESTRNDLLSIMPGNNLTTYAFCAVAEGVFQDPCHDSILFGHISKQRVMLPNWRYWKPSQSTSKIQHLGKAGKHSSCRRSTTTSTSSRFVHFGTDPSNTLFPLMFPRIEEVRSDCFWEFAGKESRSQLYGDGLNLVDCSESMLEDQLAGDEGEGSQVQPRSRDRSRSPPSLRRSSRVKRRRINYSEVSDINVDLRAKSSHDDKDDLHSDCEQESHLTSVEQSETVEFSSPEDAVPDAYGKAPVKTRSTPPVPAFTEADLVFPLTQPDELKLAVLCAALIQVAQLQTLRLSGSWSL
ncbi:hypothetical protein BFJ66_g4765 [Fusarium oxysporum f. sp. cepae]|uniref:Uncharacterized protein n=1 Tax=Fusarium oxysporum f. sp. cepae TaxID=396571 RepID=A0A3L6P8G3_FUSOX|nr:hypothetical protein BFJ65_g1802 [Fusarium oxysporum f. sp. cepae]RKK54258.1 hypothetical protein BFJ66_g4765 [Fusarium oxysporum f. sp. cepae]